MERLRLEIRPFGRIDQTYQKTYRGSSLPMPAVRTSLFQVRSSVFAHEEAHDYVVVVPVLDFLLLHFSILWLWSSHFQKCMILSFLNNKEKFVRWTHYVSCLSGVEVTTVGIKRFIEFNDAHLQIGWKTVQCHKNSSTYNCTKLF